MCTFFLRIGVITVLLAGCHRARPQTPPAQAAPRADTLVITVPVIRFVPSDNASGAEALDSVSLRLLERRVMSRLVSMMRAQTEFVSGEKSAGNGLTPTKNAAPAIRHGLLGVITFNDDGSIDVTSRERMIAVHELLQELEGALEIRAVSNAGIANIDVAIARARRVYLELVAMDEDIAQRDVVITASARNSATPVKTAVEIFWRHDQ